MALLQRTLIAVLLLAWSVTSLYVGTAAFLGVKTLEDAVHRSDSGGSYDYHGLNFADSAELANYLKQEQLGRLFPWISGIPIEFIPLLLATSAATFGGIISIVT